MLLHTICLHKSKKRGDYLTNIELIILKNLFINKKYTSKILPFIKTKYFTNPIQHIIFKIIKRYVHKYKKVPSYSIVKVEIDKLKNVSEARYKALLEYLNTIQNLKKEDWNYNWLVDETENFCKIQSAEIAVMQAIEMIEKKESLTSLPLLLQKAVNVDFQLKLGMDFFDDGCIDERWDKYNKKAIKYPSRIKKLRDITNGGVEPKTINLLIGDTGTGKTNALVSLAADYVRDGFNVLYVTLEMSDIKIGMRFDANFLNTPINEITCLDKDNYKTTLKNFGFDKRLRLKEYPTSSIGVSFIKSLLDELLIKEDFKPDIVMIDYLNIMKSDQMPKSKGSYEYVKSIAEEVRGLAVEYELAVWTATQSNRDASDRNDMGKTHTSESYGVPATLDLMIALISPDDLKEQNIQIWKDLKDRYSGSDPKKFAVLVDYSRAKITEYRGDTSELFNESEKVKFEDKKKTKLNKIKSLTLDEKNVKVIKKGFGDLIE
jgi:replicative DNA helicase